MLECIGAPLFGMASVTEIIYRIGLDHRLDIKRAHRVVATGTFERLPANKFLFDRMMRLFVEFGSYIPVATETEVRLLGLQVILPGDRSVDGMAVVTRDKKRFVLAEVPVLHASHIAMATEAF